MIISLTSEVVQVAPLEKDILETSIDSILRVKLIPVVDKSVEQGVL